MNKFKYILFITYALFIFTSAVAVITGKYAWAADSIVLAGIATALYFTRRTFNLTPFIMGALCFLMSMHGLAVFGLFKMSFFGLEYDTYIHAMFSVVLAITTFQYMGKFNINMVERAFLTLLLTLGLGLLNEVIEYSGYLYLGEGEGWFQLGPGDIGNTNPFENLMTDFFNDFHGNMVGILLSIIYHSIKGEETK